VASQTPAERLFTLTCCLLAAPRIGLSKQDIFNSVAGYSEASNDEARDKMFERDKSELRNAGVQLEVIQIDEFEPEVGSRYLIAKGSFDWPADFKLSAEQIGLAELAARAWNNQQFASSARTALARLKSRGMVEVNRELSFLSPRLLAKHSAFEPLAQAIAESKTVIFEYRVPDGESEAREVNPLKLRLIEGEWVLLAERQRALRNYLLRRITSKVRETGAVFEFSNSALIDQAEKELVLFTQSNKARIQVNEDSEAWWHFGAEASEVEISYMDESLLAEDLLEYGSEVKVLSPASLAQRVKNGLERVAKVHA
jgi:proteasome accessory factor B